MLLHVSYDAVVCGVVTLLQLLLGEWFEAGPV